MWAQQTRRQASANRPNQPPPMGSLNGCLSIFQQAATLAAWAVQQRGVAKAKRTAPLDFQALLDQLRADGVIAGPDTGGARKAMGGGEVAGEVGAGGVGGEVAGVAVAVDTGVPNPTTELPREILRGDLTLLACIGSGAFGEVHKVRVAGRSISPPWWSIRFRLALRTYPHGAYVW